MTPARSFSPETWVPDREAFIFRFQDRSFGDKATFCVPGSTLKEMQHRHPFDPVAAFDTFRSVIYRVALERIRSGSAMVQHVITAHELRAFSRAPDSS